MSAFNGCPNFLKEKRVKVVARICPYIINMLDRSRMLCEVITTVLTTAIAFSTSAGRMPRKWPPVKMGTRRKRTEASKR